MINAVFLNIFMGVPVNLSFLTSSTDLSKFNTVPVAEMRKSDLNGEKKKEKDTVMMEQNVYDPLDWYWYC